MSDYTPTTDYVRTMYGQGLRNRDVEAQFDRWLAAHDRKIAAEAWDEGFTRGFYSGQSMRSDADASESPVENPYRAEREGAGEGES